MTWGRSLKGTKRALRPPDGTQPFLPVILLIPPQGKTFTSTMGGTQQSEMRRATLECVGEE